MAMALFDFGLVNTKQHFYMANPANKGVQNHRYEFVNVCVIWLKLQTGPNLRLAWLKKTYRSKWWGLFKGKTYLLQKYQCTNRFAFLLLFLNLLKAADPMWGLFARFVFGKDAEGKQDMYTYAAIIPSGHVQLQWKGHTKVESLKKQSTKVKMRI